MVTQQETNETQVVLPKKIQELRNKYFGGDLIDFLTSPTPEEYTDFRPVGGGRKVKYIFGHYFIQKLNDAFGFLWSLDIPEWKQEGSQLIAKVVLSINIPGSHKKVTYPDGRTEETWYEPVQIRKTQFGGQEIKRFSQASSTHKVGDMMDLANDLKGAVTDGMKKCGTQLGIGLDIYAGKFEQEEKDTVRQEQVDTLIMRGEKAGMDEAQTRAWAEKELGEAVEKCEPLEVMGLIPKLVDMAKQRKSNG
jgi:hypothetical protein